MCIRGKTLSFSIVSAFIYFAIVYTYHMSDKVQFDFGEKRDPQYKKTAPKITQWVMKYSGGLINSEVQANYVILGFVALAAPASLLLFFSGKENHTSLLC